MTLKFHEVTVQFDGLTAINNLSFDVQQGNIHSIIGPNGAGKTTIFNCISRFYTPSKGDIVFGEQSLLKLKPHQVIKEGISRSFQNVELFSEMTVLENLLTGLHSKLKMNIIPIALNLKSVRKSNEESIKKANEILEILNISNIANEKVSDLSFGVQKMVDIGRAMMTDPKLLLLDEPVAGLNPVETEQISKLLLMLKKDKGFTILLIEHDMSLVMKVSDYVTVMNFGQKIAEGTPREVRENPLVIEAYLGGGKELAYVR